MNYSWKWSRERVKVKDRGTKNLPRLFDRLVLHQSSYGPPTSGWLLKTSPIHPTCTSSVILSIRSLWTASRQPLRQTAFLFPPLVFASILKARVRSATQAHTAINCTRKVATTTPLSLLWRGGPWLHQTTRWRGVYEIKSVCLVLVAAWSSYITHAPSSRHSNYRSTFRVWSVCVQSLITASDNQLLAHARTHVYLYIYICIYITVSRNDLTSRPILKRLMSSTLLMYPIFGRKVWEKFFNIFQFICLNF